MFVYGVSCKTPYHLILLERMLYNYYKLLRVTATRCI